MANTYKKKILKSLAEIAGDKDQSIEARLEAAKTALKMMTTQYTKKRVKKTKSDLSKLLGSG